MTKAMRPNYGAKCKVPLGWRVTPVSLIFPSFPLQQDLHLRCTHNPSADNKTALQPPGRGSTLAKAAVRDPELCAQGGKRHGKLPAHAASRQLQVCAAPLQPALGAAARHRHKPPPRGKSTPTAEILGPPGGGGRKGGGGVVVGSAALPLPRARTMPFFCRTKVEPFTRLDTTATLRPSDTAAGPGPGPGPGLCAAPSAAIRIAPAAGCCCWRRRSARPALPAPAPPGGGRAAGGDPPRNWGGEWGKAGL